MNHPHVESVNASEIEAFHKRLTDAWPPRSWIGHRVLVAVSGGPDSVALLRATHALSQNAGGKLSDLAVAHVNHGLRGRDSDEDQEFVMTLACKMGVAAYSRRLDETSLLANWSDGVESAARIARYEALFRIAHDVGARYLATGHTLDDQVETVLFRICRGTGVAGLAGIPAIRQVDESLTLVRPMLGLHKRDVVAYLAVLGQEARDDASNADTAFAARNWIRHELLPLVREKFGDKVDASIAQLAVMADEYRRFVANHAALLLDGAVKLQRPDLLILKKDSFSGMPSVLIQAALQRGWERQGWSQQDMSFDHWSRLVDMVLDESDDRCQYDLPRQIQVACVGRELCFSRSTNPPI